MTEENVSLVQIRSPQDRLSESFPPDSQNNFEYISDVHKILKKVDLEKVKNLSNKIFFRTVNCEEDMIQIRKLHEEWFPLPYNQSYFESIKNGSVKSIIAEYEIKKDLRVIVGCLFYMSKTSKQRYLQFKCKYFFDDFYGVYITTIGVVNKFRKCGVATMMMDKLKTICRNQPRLQYIYLHIVTYNKAGIKYYERNGFSQIETKRDHYDNIEGKTYSAYVYVCYLNGSSPPKPCLDYIFNLIATPFNYLKSLFKNPSNYYIQNNANKIDQSIKQIDQSNSNSYCVQSKQK